MRDIRPRRARSVALRMAATVLAILGAAPAHANFTCYGTGSCLALNPDGLVTINIGFGVWSVCSVAATFTAYGTTVPPESCRALYATFLAQQKAGHRVMFYFSSPASSSNGPECTALGTWVGPNPLPYHIDSVT